MENQIKLVEKTHCTGCRACSNACPTSSIKFELNGLHYYPTIDEDTCIYAILNKEWKSNRQR